MYVIGTLATLLTFPPILQETRGPTPPEVRAPPREPAGYDRCHAIVVGIDEYDDPTFDDLAYAVNDAQAIAAILVRRFGFAPDRVRLIRNDEASKQGLESALETWATDPETIGEHDLLVLFFAGHGVTRTLPRERKRGYLVPADARTRPDGSIDWSTLYEMPDLEDVCEAIAAKHVLVILDCCFSGLIVRGGHPAVVPGLGNRARQVMTAGSEGQTVLDDGGSGHSYFTAALLDGLRGAADLDGDDVYTFGELFLHVGREVEAATRSRQTPLKSELPDDEGGNVALIRPGARANNSSPAERYRALQLTAEELAEEMLGYKDALLLQDLLAEADTELWPRRPWMVPKFREWFARAAPLLDRLPEHERSLVRVKQAAFLEMVLAGIAEEGSGTPVDWRAVDPALRFRHAKLTEMIELCVELERRIPEIEERLALAETIEARTLDDFHDRWDEALTALRELPEFGELELERRVGWVPLHEDPESGLWEFWLLETGAEPRWNDERGTWDMAPQTGMVFVLVPGGTIAGDPIEPFLISKYEMTQSQWERATGENPSFLQIGNRDVIEMLSALGDEFPLPTPVHPAERVSLDDVRETLSRLALTVPTATQWEHAARGACEGRWPWGDDPTRADSFANLADAAYVKAEGGVVVARDESLEDGWPYTAPVGEFLPNGFGLHDVIGNVWEWCWDGSTLGRPAPVCGGAFTNPPDWADFDSIGLSSPDTRDHGVGVRPVLLLESAR